jgi:FkbM family methyltransferase
MISRMFAAYVALKPRLGKGFGWGLHARLYRTARRLLDPRWVQLDGFRLRLDPYDDVLSYNLARGYPWEPTATRALRERLEPGMVVVDVGAHIGYYTLVASLAVGERGRVFAFEPEPRNLRLLRRNVETNGCTNVRVVDRAVGAACGPARLALDPRNTGGHSLVAAARGDTPTIPVERVDLDGFLEREGVRPALVKIDVEGAERAVLAGMSRTLARPGPLVILIEYFPERLAEDGHPPESLLELLSSYGFALRAIEGDRLSDAMPAGAIAELARRRRLLNVLCERDAGWAPRP